ncbi:MAG: hypothetical protein H6868_05785 [Rhodospirillales bacterium]|nr:hypothetical protein [Rhodospirillales bacterium]
MKPIFYIFIIVVLLLAILPAHAAPYKITAQQNDPDGIKHSVICDSDDKICGLTIPLVSSNSEKQEPSDALEIGILFSDNDDVYLKFKHHGEFLFYTAEPASYDNSRLHISINGDEMHENGFVIRKNIQLYIPHTLSRTDPETSLVLRQGQGHVAAINVAIRPIKP